MNDKSWWKNLQPLRIQSGWSFLFNKLAALEPDNLSEDNPAWLFTLVQDILDIKKENCKQKVAIDLGWYPDGDPHGRLLISKTEKEIELL